MGEWRQITLGAICKESGGDIQTGPFGSQLHASDYVPRGIPTVMPQNIGDNWIDPDGIAMVSDSDVARLERYVLREGDIVYSRRGDVERRALVRAENDGWLCGTGCLRVRIADGERYSSAFIAYALGLPNVRAWITRHAVGATMLNLNTSILSAVPLTVPDIAEQRDIADVLGALDDKIAANDRVLARVESSVMAEYEAALLTGHQDLPLDSLAIFHNRQRIPLSSRERDARRGSVPYYGAAGRLDFVDEALFVDPLVLVGEDGSVINEDGSPVLQYVWGPSWVNNHAHVLTGKAIATETLRCALVRSNVAHLVTGAVQPKISMGNLKKLVLSVPSESTRFDMTAVNFAAISRAVSDENDSLVRTRDELLPLVMSGKVRVKDAEALAAEVV